MSSLSKVIQFLAEVPILANFVYLGVHLMSVFSTYRQNFEKSSVNLSEKVVGNIVLKFEPSVLKKLRGASCFASQLFPKSMILASCEFVGWPFVACYASTIV